MRSEQDLKRYELIREAMLKSRLLRYIRPTDGRTFRIQKGCDRMEASFDSLKTIFRNEIRSSGFFEKRTAFSVGI